MLDDLPAARLAFERLRHHLAELAQPSADVSWLMSIPRNVEDLLAERSDSGYLTYIIITRRMTSGELLKYRNGLLIAQAYHGHRRREHLL